MDVSGRADKVVIAVVGASRLQLELRESVTLVVSVDGTDDGFICEEDNGRVGDNPHEMSAHATVQPHQTLLRPHLHQRLEEGVVLPLISRHLLPQSGAHYLCNENEENSNVFCMT